MFDNDLNKLKAFGPRTLNSYVVEGSQDIAPGRDYFFDDSCILRFLVAR
jgi:hypothetical protein